MNNDYGHVGIVTGWHELNSPCHNAKPQRIELPDEDGIIPYYTVCSKCKKEYDSTELTISTWAALP